MTVTMSTTAPADLLGLGGFATRSCTDRDLRTVVGVSPAPRVAPFPGTAVPAGGSALQLRRAYRALPVSSWNAVAHNFIGTTLGICSSRRPQS